jgi:MFS-type transporter involved in bile tolerance (Atg22 family)
VSVLPFASHVSLTIVLVAMAAISALALAECVRDGDAPAAWLWLGLFIAASLGAAWSYWRLA